MTEKHYGHLSADYVTDAIRKHAPRFGKVASQREGYSLAYIKGY